MSTKATILDRAAELLAASPTGDVSTRAVCEAAGVGQPVLYRLFGDKDGLLAAVADRVWGEYLDGKRAAEQSADPLTDLRVGWDTHTAFALANPHAYRLVFGSTLSTPPEAAQEAMDLLRAVLERLAAHGRLKCSPDDAARIVMSANSGVALALLLRPEQYPDLSISTRMRDLIFGALIAGANVADDPQDPADRAAADAAQTAATTLRAQLPGSELFTEAESALLGEWLDRINTHHGTT